MNIVAIIQARMGSTRLPGKVLKDIGGETMLARVVRRTRRAALIDRLVVATTAAPADEAIVAECARLDTPYFCGSEEDVLDRYYQAAQAYQAEIVVRITSDCPFVDPEVVDEVVQAFLNKRPDFASNCLERTYPQGLDVEVTSINVLGRAWREATLVYQRIHVMPYIYQHPDMFQLLSVTTEDSHDDYRWTIDTAEDLEFARAIYVRLGNEDTFNWREVLRLLSQEPELTEINRHIRQKTLVEG